MFDVWRGRFWLAGGLLCCAGVLVASCARPPARPPAPVPVSAAGSGTGGSGGAERPCSSHGPTFLVAFRPDRDHPEEPAGTALQRWLYWIIGPCARVPPMAAQFVVHVETSGATVSRLEVHDAERWPELAACLRDAVHRAPLAPSNGTISADVTMAWGCPTLGAR